MECQQSWFYSHSECATALKGTKIPFSYKYLSEIKSREKDKDAENTERGGEQFFKQGLSKCFQQDIGRALINSFKAEHTRAGIKEQERQSTEHLCLMLFP